MAKQSRAAFWKEDADRINMMCDKAREMGLTMSVLPPGPPPKLNTDGSLVDPYASPAANAEDDEDEDDDDESDDDEDEDDTDILRNRFCPTGEGGGVDATCGDGAAKGATGSTSAKEGASRKGATRTIAIERKRGRTNEGVSLEEAATLTREEAKQVLKFQKGLGMIAGANGPNKGLPDGTRPELTEHESGSLQKYSYLSDRPLNGRLRGKENWKEWGTKESPAKTPYSDEYFDEMHSQMQSAFKKAKVLDKPVRVVRGMNIEDPAALESFVKGLTSSKDKGGDVTFDGYMSTTRPAGVLAKLGLSPGLKSVFKGNVTMKINAVHGLDMKPHSQLPGEEEFLINHKSKFKVRNVTKKADGYHVELDQVAPSS